MTTPSAAGIIFVADDKILLLKRGTDCDAPETWGLPAGKIEANETPLMCGVRETFEETGHTVTGAVEHLQTENGFATFVSPCQEFVPVLNDEHSEYVWASVDNLPTPLHPNLAELTGFVPVFDLDDTARSFDFNGWTVVNRNPISRVGVYPYLGKNLPGAEDPDRIYYIYRCAEELSDPECINSFKLLPWIDNHVMLGPEEVGRMPAERKGVQGVIGEQVYFEGDTLYANLKVFSEALAELIDSGKTELSCGYVAKYEWTSGIWNGQPYDGIQRFIRGNHLALVDTGRMGAEVSVLDHFTFTFDSQDIQMTKKELAQLLALATGKKRALTKLAPVKDADDTTKKDESDTAGKDTKGEPGENPNQTKDDADNAGDAVSDMTVEEAIAQMEALMPLLQKLAAAANLADDPAADATADTPAVATMDAAEVDRRIQSAVSAALKTNMVHVSKRDALAKQLSDYVGVFDHADKTLAEVAAYGCEKLEIQAEKGQELGALAGYFAARKAPVTRHASTMDAADGADKDNAVVRHLKAVAK